MQTPKLIIVTILGDLKNGETLQSAEGLYKKYSERTEINKQVELVHCSRAGEASKVKDAVGKGKVAIEANDRVGVYIVSHSYDLQTAVDGKHDMGKVIKKLLEDRATVTNYILDKVCLVVCGAAEGAPELEKELDLTETKEMTLIQRFAMQLCNAGLHPRLAGWTKWITGHESGKKQIIGSTSPQVKFASEATISKEKQKMVYVWNQSGYVRKKLDSWSEKTG
ncbi:MAG: hypothetical protein WAL56_20955 [Candidatus Sulfotelmatobacter sp.]